MSIDHALSFVRLMAEDAAFQQAFASAGSEDARIALAASRGLSFSDADYEAAVAQVAALNGATSADGELDDHILEHVAGGAGQGHRCFMSKLPAFGSDEWNRFFVPGGVPWRSNR